MSDWESVKKEIEAFHHAYDVIVSIPTTSEDQARKRVLELGDVLLFLRGKTKPVFLLSGSSELRRRAERFHVRIPPKLEGLSDAIFAGAKSLSGLGYSDTPFITDVKNLQQSMKDLNTHIAPFLKSLVPGPSKFTYKGLHISNPDGVPDVAVEGILRGIDFALALFKRRGVLDVLYEGLNTVLLQDNLVSSQGHTVSGRYLFATKTLVVFTNVLDEGMVGKAMTDWVAEVFIHEFGHYVHMSYLTKDARAFYDAGWEHVNRISQITWKDRMRYFDVIKKNGWDANKAGRSLRGEDRVKFLYWLYKAGKREGTVSSSPTQVRLTEFGKQAFLYFKDPDHFVRVIESAGLFKDEREIQSDIEHREKVFTSNLFLTWTGTLPVPKELTNTDPALDALGLPTDYAKENVFEDFAETFAHYMINPNSVSAIAKWRMGRALGMSASGGKAVVKLAKKDLSRDLITKIAQRYLASNSLKLLTLISKGRKGPINLNTLKSDLAPLGFRVEEAFVSYEPKNVSFGPVAKYFERVSPSKSVWISPYSQEKKFLKKGEMLFYMPHDEQIPFRGLKSYILSLPQVTEGTGSDVQIYLSNIRPVEDWPLNRREGALPITAMAARVTAGMPVCHITAPSGAKITVGAPLMSNGKFGDPTEVESKEFWQFIYANVTKEDADAVLTGLSRKDLVKKHNVFENTGTCGACFRNHKLYKNGTLVQHGYTLGRWGARHNVCFGVGYPPFELSKKATTGWLEELKSEVKEVQEALKRAEGGAFPSTVTLDTGGGIMREFTIDPSDTSRKAEYVRKKVLSSYRDQLHNINRAMKDVEANLRTWKPMPLPGDT